MKKHYQGKFLFALVTAITICVLGCSEVDETSEPNSIVGIDVVKNSAVFGDQIDQSHICIGDANNDGSIDIVVGKHKDFGTGKIAMFQFIGNSWDAGAVIYTAPSFNNGILFPTIGETQNDGFLRIVYGVHGQGNTSGSLEVTRIIGTTPSQTKTLKSTGWPGELQSGIGDIDGDGKNEIYATVYASTIVLNKYTYDSFTDSYLETLIRDTGLTSGAGSRPIVGNYSGTGSLSLIYCFGSNSLHHLTYSAGYSSTEIFSTTEGCYSLRDGNIDSYAGTDIVIITGATSPTVHLISGGSFTKSYLGSPNAIIRTISCADLDGDGTDEMYCGASNGGIYRYDMILGWSLVEVVLGVIWNDSSRARWAGASVDEVVFSGVEGSNLTVRRYRHQP